MSDLNGAVIRTSISGPRVELDAEGSWYADDDGMRIPWAEYLASRPPMVLPRALWPWR